MVSLSHCMLQGAEICLDAAELRRNLLALIESSRMDSRQREHLVQESKQRWQELSVRLNQLGDCDVSLVDMRPLKDIEANVRALDPKGRFLDHDGPLIAAQVDHLVRFELLTSLGAPPRT